MAILEMAISSIIKTNNFNLEQTENFLDIGNRIKIINKNQNHFNNNILKQTENSLNIISISNLNFDTNNLYSNNEDPSSYYQKIISDDNYVICEEIDDLPSYDDYIMSTNWKEIESVVFPETEEFNLGTMFLEETKDYDLESWL